METLLPRAEQLKLPTYGAPHPRVSELNRKTILDCQARASQACQKPIEVVVVPTGPPALFRITAAVAIKITIFDMLRMSMSVLENMIHCSLSD